MQPLIYQRLREALETSEHTIKQFCLGLTWSYCELEISDSAGLGFAQSSAQPSRTLPWPGTLAQSLVSSYAGWLDSWDPHQMTAVIAMTNAVINSEDNTLLNSVKAIPASNTANLSVFEYFKPRLQNKKVAVIGHYPGLETLELGDNLIILERTPVAQDLPDPAAEYVLPDADWVFISATSLINKTFPRLAELAKDAVTVLLGPTTPWLAEFKDYHIDYLAGVRVQDSEACKKVAMEGGGTGLFNQAVQYAVINISNERQRAIKAQIGQQFAQREELKLAMEAWYTHSSSPFPQRKLLTQTDSRLSALDSAYKRLWDATHLGDEPCL